MQLPPFMGIQHDTAARKALLKVQDPEIRRQREMWGAQHLHIHLVSKVPVDMSQAQRAPTSRTTSSASQKDTRPFCV